MSRLTIKNENVDFLTGVKFEYETDDLYAVDKLGTLEDLEEELGIDLLTLFKALKTNIWNEKTHRQEWVVLDYSNNEFVLKTTKELYIDDNKCILLLKDYGKTWALDRNDLED